MASKKPSFPSPLLFSSLLFSSTVRKTQIRGFNPRVFSLFCHFWSSEKGIEKQRPEVESLVIALGSCFVASFTLVLALAWLSLKFLVISFIYCSFSLSFLIHFPNAKTPSSSFFSSQSTLSPFPFSNSFLTHLLTTGFRRSDHLDLQPLYWVVLLSSFHWKFRVIIWIFHPLSENRGFYTFIVLHGISQVCLRLWDFLMLLLRVFCI